MNRNCFIKLCPSSYDRENTSISFHKFPKDDWKCKKWMEALKLDKIRPGAAICSNHFHQKDFINDVIKIRRRLYPSAIPYLSEEYENPKEDVFEIEEPSMMEIPLPPNIITVERPEIRFVLLNQIHRNITLDNQKIANEPKVDSNLASKVVAKQEKIKLKVETLRRSDNKSKKKIKILHQKIRRQTQKLTGLRQRISIFKQPNRNSRTAGTKIDVKKCNTKTSIKEINIKPTVVLPGPPPELTFPDSKNDSYDDQSKLLDDVSEFTEDRLMFEVNFKSEKIFNEYKDLVIEGLRVSLTDKGFFVLVEDDTKIQIFREFPIVDDEQKNKTEICEKITNEMDFVMEVKSDQGAVTDVKPNIETLENEDSPKQVPKDEQMEISELLTIKTQHSEEIDAIKIPSSKEIPKPISILKTKKTKVDYKSAKQKKSNNIGTDHSLRTGPKPENSTNIKRDNNSINQPEVFHIEQRFLPLQWNPIHMPLAFETHLNLSEVVDPLL